MGASSFPAHHLELIELLDAQGKYREMCEMAFQLIDEDNEGTLPVFKRCLTTGSMQARRQTAESIHALVVQISNTRTNSDRPAYYNEQVWHPNSISNMLWVWNSLNVLDECGITYVDEDNDILIMTNMVESIYSPLHREALEYPVDDEHWRGLAIMALANIRPIVTKEQYNDLFEYVAWAGKHENVLSIIDVTRERKTYNVSTLKGILPQHANTTSGLKSGVL